MNQPQFTVKSTRVIDDISSDLYDQNMPEISEHAIEAEKQEEEKGIIKDKIGDIFNPDHHAVNKDGTPKLTVIGTFAKKRGRKTGSTGQTSTIGKPGASPNQSGINHRATGAAIAESIFMTGRVLGGEEWEPIKNDNLGIDERATMTDAWTQYAQAKGMKDLPPGVIVSIALISYVGPRLNAPKTKSRFKLVVAWLKNKWSDRKNARTDSRNDGKRENDASEATLP